MPIGPVVIAAFLALGQDARSRAECREWHECQQAALDAAARQDYETFHDLAWRAVQTGPKNDASLMFLLARAQSLSGRLGDALVMLTRLVDRGVSIDADSNDDFLHVRQLPGWTALHERIATRASGPSEATRSVPGAGPAPTPPTVVTPKPPGAIRPPAAPNSMRPIERNAPAATRGDGSGAATGVTAIDRTIEAADAARFGTPGRAPIGIAYDAVSRRFIVADRATRKLAVVDEFTQHVATLAGAQAAFATIGAIEIDPREGNLWVVSSEPSEPPKTTLHKLQLISGRVLSTFALPATLAPGRFVDVAVAPGSTVLALDGAQARIFKLRGDAFEVLATFDAATPTSLAPTDGGVIYVAHAEGILRIVPGTPATAVAAPKGQSLASLSRIRWHQGALVGIQRNGDELKAVRILLDRTGRSARAVELLDRSSAAADETAATITGDMLYYLVATTASDAIVRRIRLK